MYVYLYSYFFLVVHSERQWELSIAHNFLQFV